MCKYLSVYCYFVGDGHTKPKPRKGQLPEPTEYKCLIRAALGNKKISTVVSMFVGFSIEDFYTPSHCI